MDALPDFVVTFDSIAESGENLLIDKRFPTINSLNA